MHFLTASSSCLLYSQYPFLNLSTPLFPSVLLVVDGSRRRRMVMRQQVAVKETGSLLGYSDSFKKGSSHMGLHLACSGFLRRCKDWDSDGDFSLEAEILEFMKNSKNPQAFPSKKDLIDGGRKDLADAIIRKGGWLSFGWDLDEEREDGLGEMDVADKDSLIVNESNVKNGGNKIQDHGIRGSGAAPFLATGSQLAMPSSRPAKMEAEVSGIEGILNRLEKQRNNYFGLHFKEKDMSFGSSDNKDELRQRNTTDSSLADILGPTTSNPEDIHSKHDQNRSLSGGDPLNNSLASETWRSWSIQRAGISDADFEAGEIAASGTREGGLTDILGSDMLEIRESGGEPINREKHINSLDGKANQNEIKSRLQQLESELSSVLHLLRSTAEVAIDKDQEGSPDDLQKLSDVWEFQENEIMNAQDRLRSIRAKLAVSEGKMALAIIDAQKMVEEKEKRIEGARRALNLLRATCIVWPNSASEVLLAGSFDGWSTQRKMEKSSTGIFSAWLKLYPGKYEIKFIVDGEWRIDPLRPIVHNNGYENNLLIVQDE